MTERLINEKASTRNRHWLLALGAWGVHVLAFVPLYRLSGVMAIASAIVPTLVSSWLWGSLGGGLAALLALPANLALLSLAGGSVSEALSSGGLLGWMLTFVVGVLSGRLNDVAHRKHQEVAERQEIERALQQQNLQLRTLLDTAEMLSTTLRFEPLLDQTLDQLGELVSYDTATVILVDDDWAQVVQCRGWACRPGHQRVSLSERSLINQVVEGRRPVTLSRPGDSVEAPMRPGGAPLKSWLAVPLTARDQVVGALTIGSRAPDAYDERTTQLVAAFGHQTALALENSRLYEQTRSQLRDMTVLQGVTSAISSTLEVDQILPYVARSLCRMLNATSVEIYAVQKGDEVASLAASYTAEEATEQERDRELERRQAWQDDPYAAQALSEQKPVEARIEDQDLAPATRAKLEARQAKAMLLLPIVVREQALGYVYVWDSATARDFTEGEIATGQTLIHQTAIAMENARLIEESQRRVNHLAGAADVARRVAAIGDPASLLDVVVDLIQERFGFRLAAVLLIDEASQELYPAAATDDFWKIIPDGYRQPVGEGAIGTAAQTGEILSIPDVTKGTVAYRVGDWFSPSSLSVPIKMGGLVIGVLQAEADVINAFDESDRVALEVIADQIAIAYQNAELLTETRSRVKDLQLLHDVSLAAASSTHLRETLQAAAEALAAEWESTQVALQLVDEETKMLRMMASVGYPVDESKVLDLRLGEGITGWVAEHGEPALVPDVHADPRYFAANPDTRSELCVPLNAGGGVLGTLNVESCEPHAFTLDDQRLLSTLGSNLAMLIERARLFEQVEEARVELQQRAEDLEQANRRLQELDRLKSQFLANMSHELRTPLNSVIGFSEVLIDGLLGEMPPERKECVENIYASGEHLMALINDVLDLSKIEAGRMELTLEEFDIADLIANVQKTIAPMIEEKSQRLILDLAENLPPLHADRVRVRQVLLNLLSNAHKFTPERKQITLSCRLADSNTLLFSVIDTGVGIREKDQELIFEEFRQADGSTTREVEGTGLGLTISRRLVEMHCGTIWVESSYGEGATFSFLLPLSGPPSEADGTEGGWRLAASVPRVLIVEDNRQFAQLLSVYLRRDGYSSVVYDRSRGIVDQAQQLVPSLIILDVTLDEQGGWAVLEELKSDPHTKSIPVRAISVQPGSGAAVSINVTDYLLKPVDRAALQAALTRVSDNSRDGHGLRVLVIDEDPQLVRSLQAMFEDTTHTFIPVYDAQEGPARAAAEEPDAVLLNLMMTGVSGFQLLERMRDNQRTTAIPIIGIAERGTAPGAGRRFSEHLSTISDEDSLTGP